jgi:hypothetical protein
VRARARLAGFIAAAPLFLVLGAAHAQQPEARVTADDVTVDARSQVLSLRGHVDVEADPFHLTSDSLDVVRTPRGLVVTGDGRVAFCPCLHEPVALDFKGATVAPPGDLFLTEPRLEAGGVPFLWLPWFWLRSSGRIGLLPPDIAYRGSDGLFLGEGVHLPWRSGDLDSGLDVHAGAYVDGGFAVESTLKTPISLTTVRVDDLNDQVGVTVDARGSTSTETVHAATLSWDADIIRGVRGVVSTTDVDAASRVFDRAAAESSWRGGTWVVAAGVVSETVRGGNAAELDAAGPVVRARTSGALSGGATYDATVEGGDLDGAGLSTLSYARGDVGTLLASRLGPVGASLDLRGGGDLADQGTTEGYDAAASMRGRLALPISRTFTSDEPGDGWRHRIEPEVEVGGLAAQSDGLLGEIPSPGGIRGAVWLADAGVRTALGQWGLRRGVEAAVDAGGVGGEDQEGALAVRWRAAANAPYLGLGAEGASVVGPSGGAGQALRASVRVGGVRTPSVALLVAGRDGVDPVLARALTDAPLASSSGFLSVPGWTGGARLTLPISAFVTARGGADGDLTAERLVAVRGSLEVHDRCGCFGVRLSASERLGRDGVDVWLSVDLASGGMGAGMSAR